MLGHGGYVSICFDVVLFKLQFEYDYEVVYVKDTTGNRVGSAGAVPKTDMPFSAHINIKQNPRVF